MTSAARFRKLRKTFAEDLRVARAQARLSQRELSERSGVGERVVSAAEAGREDLTMGTMAAFGDVFGKDVVVRFESAEPPRSRGRKSGGRRAGVSTQPDDDDLRPRLAANLVEARVRAGLTYRHLASRADVSKAYISRIERGALNATLDTVSRLARALGVAPEYLLRSRSGGTAQKE